MTSRSGQQNLRQSKARARFEGRDSGPQPALSVVSLVLLLFGPAAFTSGESLREASFTALWWVNGPPSYLSMRGPAPSPVLCLRSGEIGVLIDTKSLRILHGGRFGAESPKDATMEAGTGPLLALPPLDLKIAVIQSGRTFSCLGRGPAPKDEFFQPIRFVETGRFFQRVAIAGLEFAAEDGTKLPLAGTLEIALWPDRLALTAEMEDRNTPGESELSIMAAGRRVSTSLGDSRRVTLPLFVPDAEPPLAHVEADPALTTSFDPALGCHVLRLPEQPWTNTKGTYYPEEHLDRLDRWNLKLRNDSERESVARLMFIQEKNLPITGFTPMLCDPDGAPTGVPVQISKNWHQRPDKGRLEHEGPWFHGCAFVRLPPRSRRDLRFQMAYARYGGVPAASHAQLSLIGWGHNQFWDQAAIGGFGESICYEPGRVQRRCFIDDMRPLLTLPVAGGKPWGWAENCGGGDFLLWVDEQDAYRGFRATRADYRSQGPCQTDVCYREETSGGEIQARMEVSLTRSDDYVRAFHRVRYDVLQPVKWRRLAFFQLGADFYNDTPARRVAIGDADGLREAWMPPRAQGEFDRRELALTGTQPWVSIHGLDRAALGKGSAAASRGLIVRAWRAQLNGKPSPVPHLSTYCNEWGRGNHRTAVELAPPPGVTSLQPGDFIDAEVEIVVFPADPKAYYGPNAAFRDALAAAPDTWQLVHREASGNSLRVTTRSGLLTRAFPLAVAVVDAETAVVDVDGGIGWLPVTFSGLTRHRGYELRVNGQSFNQSVHGNDYWQTDYNSAAGTWSQTFNLPRDARTPLHLEFGPAATGAAQPSRTP